MATMMEDQSQLLAYFHHIEMQGGTVVKEPPKFDLELWLSNYSGRTRFDRLLVIGQCSIPLAVEALKLAVAEAKKGKDIERYRHAWEYMRIAAPSEPEAQWDEAWVSKTDKDNKQETHRLEVELKGYKNNLVKESIRIGHRDMGEHLESIGDLQGAADAYIRMRADASTQAHIVDVAKHSISIMLQRRDWPSVLANVNKMMAATMSDEEQKTQSTYQKIVSGLAYLHSGKCSEAAKCFLEVGDVSICQMYNDVITPNDVATYGGLLALACMDRSELQSRVLDNAGFRNYLELEPHIRKAVRMFVDSRYTQCLSILESYRPDYLLDIHLQKHVSVLFSQIRAKCIIQYLIPFSCVTMDSLNAAFGKPGESLEEELVGMIKSGTLKARVNTIDKILSEVAVHRRVDMQTKGLETAKSYEKEALERIRRLSIAAADLEVKGGKKGAGPSTEDTWFDDTRRQMMDQLGQGEMAMG